MPLPLCFPVTCNPSRAVTLPDIGVPHRDLAIAYWSFSGKWTENGLVMPREGIGMPWGSYKNNGPRVPLQVYLCSNH